MTIRLYMSMSLDGYIAGPDDREGQELGRGGGRLFNWLDERNGPGINGQVYAEALATGAIISGRRTFELAGRWNGDHHDDVPILILTRHRAGEPPAGNVRFFDDVERVLRRPGASRPTGRSWCTAPAPRRPCSPRASWTSWRSTSCQSCSVPAGRCSAGSEPGHELELVRCSRATTPPTCATGWSASADVRPGLNASPTPA